jgi:hypothetical protein
MFNAARGSDALMQVMDRINAIWGRGTLHPAAEGESKAWGGASGVDVAEVGNAVEGVAKGGAVVRPTEIWAAKGKAVPDRLVCQERTFPGNTIGPGLLE